MLTIDFLLWGENCEDSFTFHSWFRKYEVINNKKTDLVKKVLLFSDKLRLLSESLANNSRLVVETNSKEDGDSHYCQPATQNNCYLSFTFTNRHWSSTDLEFWVSDHQSKNFLKHNTSCYDPEFSRHQQFWNIVHWIYEHVGPWKLSWARSNFRAKCSINRWEWSMSTRPDYYSKLIIPLISRVLTYLIIC